MCICSPCAGKIIPACIVIITIKLDVYLFYMCRYDIIGKYEHLVKDSDFILESIGAPSDVRFPPYHPSKASEVFNKYMSELTPELTQQLKSVYAEDFHLFGYETIENSERKKSNFNRIDSVSKNSA